MKGQIPFATGTVVMVASGAFKGRNIIHETSVVYDEWGPDNTDYSIEYTTNKGAWVSHHLCTLLNPASPETMAELVKDLQAG